MVIVYKSEPIANFSVCGILSRTLSSTRVHIHVIRTTLQAAILFLSTVELIVNWKNAKKQTTQDQDCKNTREVQGLW